ncbi:MAG: ribonuclease H-like domain-containing protein [Myxococcaceae bacterium]|nr:ribonuclease H-like domain-containing protein [Myxococcaceae bacterium]MCA3012661.1 ribonuclease H-like domain-containing protein [Myxococcaceae bacterium]
MSGFLERTFQLSKGVGPFRERELWARGLERWDQFEAAAAKGTVMSPRLDAETVGRIAEARAALAAGDVPRLAALVPPREHWRLYPHFVDQTVFFDIEADGDEQPTVVGLMDRAGVATFRRGHTLQGLPERLAASPIWVTFNGAAFDVPTLRKAFAEGGFPEAIAHVDLRFLVRRVGLKGGLKGIEEALQLDRPPHLKGVRGLDAVHLWRLWNAHRDVKALRVLVEYNLYDAINLRSVLEWCLWRLAEESAWHLERRPRFERGEVLYDVSKLLLALP